MTLKKKKKGTFLLARVRLVAGFPRRGEARGELREVGRLPQLGWAEGGHHVASAGPACSRDDGRISPAGALHAWCWFCQALETHADLEGRCSLFSSWSESQS